MGERRLNTLLGNEHRKAIFDNSEGHKTWIVATCRGHVMSEEEKTEILHR
jgi:hypothetical protein